MAIIALYFAFGATVEQPHLCALVTVAHNFQDAPP